MTSVGSLAELKTAFASKLAIVKEGMEKGVKVDGDKVEVSQESADAIKAAYDECQEIKSYIDIAQMVASGEQQIDVKTVEQSMAMQDALRNPKLVKSLGEMLVESQEFKDMRTAKSTKMDSPLIVAEYDLASMGRKDVYTYMNPQSITRGFGSIQFDGTVPRGQRRARVRDLFPQAATSANLIDFFQVLGFVENNTATGNVAAVSGGSGNAQAVADYVPGSAGPPIVPGTFGIKPKSNLIFRPNQAPVRTIAHWEAAHRNVLDDEPQMEATVNNELLYGLALEEDFQILAGDGTGENLLGILNTPHIQTYTAATGEIGSDTLRKAATLSIIANYPSTGYVLHPNDWEGIEIQKGSGDGQYMLFTSIAIGAQATVWRNPVVETPAIPEGTFLTGAFGTGAQLYDRQQGNIRVADQHADFFVRNAIVILAEERLALAVKRPEAFIKGAFSSAFIATV